MTDARQLLEDAARAAGIVIHAPSQKRRDDGGHGHAGLWTMDQTCWNPLTDDGDALRLAVAIGPLEFSISEYGTAVRRPNQQWHGCEANLHGGKQAATRLAITRCAAAIGERMRLTP